MALGHAATAHAQQEDMSTLFDFAHVLAYFVAGLLIGLFVLVFRNRLIYFRERAVNEQNRSHNAQLALVLKANRLRVWTYDVAARRFRLIDNEGGSAGEYSPIDFAQQFEHDDFEEMRRLVFAIRNGEEHQAVLTMHGVQEGKHRREYQVSIKKLEVASNGQPVTLIGLEHDVTESRTKKRQASDMLQRYHTMFDESLIDMVYYDANGVMTDVNANACATFNIADRQTFLESKPKIEEHPGYQDVSLHDEDTRRYTTIIHGKKVELYGLPPNSDMYYDMEISTIRDAEGKLTGIFAAGHNVSELADSHRRQVQATRQLRQATRQIENYISNINYALEVSEVRLMNYYPHTHILEISNDLRAAQYQFTQLRCLDLVAPDQLAKAKHILRTMDYRRDVKIVETLRTVLHDKQGRPMWLAFNIMPLYGADGRVDHYFGMCRNETELVATETQLKQETLKAQETELLKDAFLMNMSYEIRTPLNAVLGFASLLSQEHGSDDESLFIEQIKTNTNSLLELVNDVLFISRLDANMIEIKREYCDFALLFDAQCHMGWSALLKPGVKTIVENPYNHLVVDIDQENLSHVINRLCTNAAYFTQEGTLRAKYEYRRGSLNITIEDSGIGIAPGLLSHVFDRFVRDEQGRHCGTGLVLPIVKELVEQMDGIIDISSELGKGTTVWVTIPCHLKQMDKKREIMAQGLP